MELLSVLSWVLLGCLGLFLFVFLMGKVMYLDQQAQEAGRFSWFGFGLRLNIWIVNSVTFALFVESWFFKVSIVILGVSIAVATEVLQIKSFKKRRNESIKATEW